MDRTRALQIAELIVQHVRIDQDADGTRFNYQSVINCGETIDKFLFQEIRAKDD